MIDHAPCDSHDVGEADVDDADRARWRAQLSATRAGRPCGCGMCPSIELTDALGRTPDMTISRVVLGASAGEASLLLFIDDDQLSYLELAPAADEESLVGEFPDPADISST